MHGYHSILFILIASIVTFPRGVSTNLFTSIVRLKQLPDQEMRMLEALNNFLDTVTMEDCETKNFLAQFFDNATEANYLARDNVLYLERPTNAFHFIKRLVSEWDDVINMICSNEVDDSTAVSDFCNKSESIKQTTGLWPSSDDLKGATAALIRLVDFYHLDFFGLFNGTIHGIRMLPLAIEDFLFVTNVAEEENRDYLASVFYEKILEVIDHKGHENLVWRTMVRRKLAVLYYKNSMTSRAIEVLDKAVKDNNCHSGAKRDLELYKSRSKSPLNDEPKEISRPDYFIPSDIMSTYRRLCRSEIRKATELSILFCKYRRTKVPFILSKQEYMNIEPPVVLYHDIITDKEIARVKQMATIGLHRSKVGNEVGLPEIRISQTAWLEDDDPVLLGLSRKVELHTGYSAIYTPTYSHAESWQVLNYGMGGLYVPHDDSVKEMREQVPKVEEAEATRYSGDRMATFLFYLNDVTAGGATVFPRLRARIPVVKLSTSGFGRSVKRL